MDIEKLVEEGARVIEPGRWRDYDMEAANDPEWAANHVEISLRQARAVIALTLKAAAENWIAVAQSGFDAWASKPHNARWIRKIDGTPIPNDLTICIGEAFANHLRAISAQVEKTNG